MMQLIGGFLEKVNSLIDFTLKLANHFNISLDNLSLNEEKIIIALIQEKCSQQDEKFSIFYNELILLNNNMVIETKEKLTMFVPYTLLEYFITNNETACKNVHQFFTRQISNSKALNQSGIKEQRLFFNRTPSENRLLH